VLTVLSPVSVQAAAHHNVAVVRPDPQWLRSVEIALSAWDINVIGVDAQPPGSTLPEAQRRAAELASRLPADAVVWISEADRGSVLWIYDVETQHVGSRVLADRPPFDEPTAAAAALSVKALLRASPLAPAPERLNAPPAATAQPIQSHSALWVEAEVGARALPVDLAEPRAALGLALWPRGMSEKLGFAIAGSAGLGVPKTTGAPTELDARFTDISMSASVRTRIRIASAFQVEPALGATVHVTTVQGSATAGDAPVVAHRVDAALEGGVAFDVRTGNVCIGLRAVLDYLPRYQEYVVHGVEAFSLTPFMTGVALRISTGVL
jgi:hypothetical protein